VGGGVGGSGLVFGLDATEQAQLDAFILANAGIEKFARSVQRSRARNGGNDVIQAAQLTAAIPEPSTWAMLILVSPASASWPLSSQEPRFGVPHRIGVPTSKAHKGRLTGLAFFVGGPRVLNGISHLRRGQMMKQPNFETFPIDELWAIL